MLGQAIQQHFVQRREFYEFIAIPCFILTGMAIVLSLSRVNEALFITLNSLGRHFPDVVWASLTVLGDGWVAIVLGSILLIYHPRLLMPILVAILLTALLSHSLKLIFAVVRPAGVLEPEMIHIIGQKLIAHNSFPSGHTVTAFTLTGLVAQYFRDPRLVSIMFVCALLIGLSRIFVGAHWPADVMFGGAVGWFIAWLALKIEIATHDENGRQYPRLLSKLAFLVIAVLLFWHNTHYDAANWLVYGIAAGTSVLFITTMMITLIKSAAGGAQSPVNPRRTALRFKQILK